MFPSHEFEPSPQGDVRYHVNEKSCSECKHNPETGTVHLSCLNLYAKLVDTPRKWYRLWVASVSVVPWPLGPSVLPVYPRLDLQLFTSRASVAIGMLSLRYIPPELATMIMEYSEPCELLRLCTVEGQVTKWLHQDDGALVYEPIRKLRRWRRGSPPKFRDRESQHPVRVVVDARGIRCIEPLHACAHHVQPGDHFAFITPNQDDSLMIEVSPTPKPLYSVTHA